MLNIKILLRIVGSLFLVEAGMFLLCLIISLCYGEADSGAFLYAVLLSGILGFILKCAGRHSGNRLNRRDAVLTVSFIWIVFSLMGMVPMLLSGTCTNVTDAFFENMSGFTTTGASVLSNVDAVPHGLLFWRSMTQWVGGIGIIFFTIVILAPTGESSVRLFSAEATGPTFEKLHPRVRTTAKWMFSIYMFLTLSCTVCLWISGMNLFDALNHAMCTIATGGFSTHSAGIMYYHSAAIEYVEIFFMFISGVNFALLCLSFKKKSLMVLLKDSEYKFYLITFLSVSAIAAAAMIIHSGRPFWEAVRSALFNVITIQTTTGYASEDFSFWWRPVWIALFFVMISGACARSTSGGLKCIRMLTFVRITVNHFRQMLHPNAYMPVRINHITVTETAERGLIAFTFAYFILIALGTFILSVEDISFFDSVNIVTSCISNIGVVDGKIYSPVANLADLSAVSKWTCSFLMLVGRLEIFPILLPLIPAFWKNE